MFKVGDKVRAIPGAPYNITKEGWVGIVKSVDSDGEIDVFVEGQGTFDVNSEWFEYVDVPVLPAEHPECHKGEISWNERLILKKNSKITSYTSNLDSYNRVVNALTMQGRRFTRLEKLKQKGVRTV